MPLPKKALNLSTANQSGTQPWQKIHSSVVIKASFRRKSLFYLSYTWVLIHWDISSWNIWKTRLGRLPGSRDFYGTTPSLHQTITSAMLLHSSIVVDDVVGHPPWRWWWWQWSHEGVFFFSNHVILCYLHSKLEFLGHF